MMQTRTSMTKRSAEKLGDSAASDHKAKLHKAGEDATDVGRFGAFHVDDMTRLRRFLILGCEGGTYYANQQKLKLENAQAVERLLKVRGSDVVTETLAVSVGGRAAKQSPTLFVLAMAARLGDADTRKKAYTALLQVARTPTMLFEFIGYSESLGSGTGWGRGMRRAVAAIYNGKAPTSLAHWITKYRNREGWCHRDVLRLAHVKPSTAAHSLVMKYTVEDKAPEAPEDEVDAEMMATIDFLIAVEKARRSTDEKEVVTLIQSHKLVREHIPSPLLGSVEVWAALLKSMPLTAMMRNLAKMTSIGLLAPLSDAVDIVVEKLGSAQALRAARIHPFSVLVAHQTYQRGRGIRGSLSWDPIPQVTQALDKAFYTCFDNIEPTGKRFVLAMDVSGSMSCCDVLGTPGMSPRVASAALALATMRTEPKCYPMAFTSTLVPLKIDASMGLNDVLDATSCLPFGGTDCAQPMLWALRKKVKVDVFVVFTDCETWAGSVTPAEALRLYRNEMEIDARLAVIAMTSGGFTLADPEDSGMLDMCGFDASGPQILRDFATGVHDMDTTLNGLKL